MASEHTANYGLSQWAGTDAFSRLDFNADNLALDTALKQMADTLAAMPLVQIKKKVADTNCQQLSLNVSDVDFSEYLYVELILDLDIATSNNSSHYLRLNNISTNTYRVTTSIGNTGTSVSALVSNEILPGSGKSKRIRFTPCEGDACVTCEYLQDGGTGNSPFVACCTARDVTWDELTTFDYIASSAAPLKAGSGMYLIGVKKL